MCECVPCGSPAENCKNSLSSCWLEVCVMDVRNSCTWDVSSNKKREGAN